MKSIDFTKPLKNQLKHAYITDVSAAYNDCVDVCVILIAEQRIKYRADQKEKNGVVKE